MIIELYGLPGSGKTTIAGKMKAIYGLTSVTLDSKWELLKFSSCFAVHYPHAFFLTFWLILKHSKNLHMFYYKFMNVLLYRTAKYEKASAIDGNTILDEGLFQNILSLFEKVMNEKALARYISVIPRPGLLVVLNIPRSKREQLLSFRKRIPRKEYGEEYRVRWEEILEQNNALFCSIVKGLSIPNIITAEPDTVMGSQFAIGQYIEKNAYAKLV